MTGRDAAVPVEATEEVEEVQVEDSGCFPCKKPCNMERAAANVAGEAKDKEAGGSIPGATTVLA
jgi:hypothetical protein